MKKIVATLLGLVVSFALVTAASFAYNEAPMLKKLVEAGKLPPVDQRLPKEPMIIEPVEEIGQYGGTWHYGIPTRSQLGVFSYCTYDFIARWDRAGRKIIPNVAKGWEFSSDGKTLTLFLREGMKWSDGHPFTADDILFWYEDIIGNDELTPSKPTWLKVRDELPVVKKIDDYTVSLTFLAPPGLILEQFATTRGSIFAPKHYLKQFHPAYTSKDKLEKLTKDAGFDRWYQLFGNKYDWYYAQNPDYPVINAWKVKTPLPGSQTTYERNPYYWKVDTAGNQLPYLDQVTVVLTTTAETLNLKAMAGEFDFQMRYLSPGNFTLFMKNREKGNYRVLQWPTGIGSDAALFPNQSIEDPVLRKLMQDKRFRRALSLAINREEINELIFQGRGEPRQATVVRLSPLFKEEYARAYAEYDPDRANKLLDELGLTERDSKGYRLRPDGKTLSLLLESPGEKTQTVDTIELVVEYWKNIGIDAAAKHSERSAFRQRAWGNKVEVSVWEMGFAVYPVMPRFLIPDSPNNYMAPEFGRWYVTGGEKGMEPTPDIKEALSLFDKIKETPDVEKKNKLFQDILQLQAENIWVIGLVGDVREILIAKNDFRNVPEVSIFDSIVGRYIGLTAPEQYFIKR